MAGSNTSEKQTMRRDYGIGQKPAKQFARPSRGPSGHAGISAGFYNQD
jgi:hypothetical protein